MAEINPIQGPIGPNNAEKKDKQQINPEKFKEEEQKVQKIRETDPEAKKKRKRKEEEDIPPPEEQGPLTPKPSTRSLEASPFEIQSPSSKGKLSQAHTTAQVPIKESYTPTAPSEPNLGEEGGFGDEDAFLQNLASVPKGYTSTSPSPPVKQATPPSPQKQAPIEEPSSSRATPNYPQQVPSQNVPSPNYSSFPSQQAPQNPSSTSPPRNDQKTSETTPSDKDKDHKTTTGTPGAAVEKSEKKPGSLEPPAHRPTEKEGLTQKETFSTSPTQHPAPIKAAPSKEKTKESPEDVSLEGAIPGPSGAISSQGTQQDKGDSDKKDKDSPSTGLNAPAPDPTNLPPPQTVLGAGEPLPVYTSFHPAVLEMFDKMVSTIEILQFSSGERKTTITLTSPQFANSAFFGAEIIIEEDTSVAPGQYNIKLLGSPEAVNLFQANMNDLVAAFQSGKYNFKVHRLEAGIQTTEKGFFKRKEKASGGEASSDQGQDGN